MNGVLAEIEIAVISVRLGRVRKCAASGDPRAVALEELRRSPDRFFATIRIGISLVGALAAAVGGGEEQAAIERRERHLLEAFAARLIVEGPDAAVDRWGPTTPARGPSGSG